MLLLVARDLLLHDPPRVLAWRLLHEARLADLPSWLRLVVPAGAPFDRDPLALLLAAGCSGVALALVIAAVAGARARVRAALLALGALCAVVLPTVALMAMGAAMDRPYGQDGGVVQLPLALDLLLEGRSPYGADYSASILGRQARVSPFWRAYGGNPLMRHHAYLPGTHLLMMPAHLLARTARVAFDPRAVTLLALAAAAWLAARLAGGRRGPEGALAAAAVVLVNPLVYWPQAFGANDIVQAALLLGAVALAVRGRTAWCGAMLGLACASKQLAWPYAPFLLAHLSGARALGDFARPDPWRRMARPAAAAAAVFAAILLPVIALDPRGFWGDIVVYNVGLPAADSYPLGGTPGFGAANFLIYFARVASLRDHVSFAPFYAILAPLCLLLLRRQLREAHPAAALVTGSVALLASVYVSRVAHPNYLVLAAILLPVGLLACRRAPGDEEPRATGGWPAEAAVAPLLLLLLAVELVEHEPLRAVWEDAAAARLPAYASGAWAALAPRAGPHLTVDPLGLLFGAVAAGLGVAWAAAAVLGAAVRWRVLLGVLALASVVGVPAVILARVGDATGVPRAQDAWFTEVSRAARAGRGVSDPAPAREAWSQSFRLDPPRELAAAPGAPAQRALGRVLGALGAADPRPLLAAALLAAGLVAAWLARSGAAPLAFAAAALTPAAAMGAVFGSAEPLILAFALAAALAPSRIARGGLLSLALLSASAYWAPSPLAPALGLPNVLLQCGAESVPRWLLPLLGLVAAAAILALALRRGTEALLAAAAAVLAWVWLSPAASPNAVAIPVALMALSAIADRRSRSGPDARAG